MPKRGSGKLYELNGEQHTLTEWCRLYGVPVQRTQGRSAAATIPFTKHSQRRRRTQFNHADERRHGYMKKATEIIDERQLVDELHKNWKTRGYTDGGMAELLEITPKTIHYKISGNFPYNGYKAHFKVNEILQIIHYLGFKLYLVREDDVK